MAAQNAYLRLLAGKSMFAGVTPSQLIAENVTQLFQKAVELMGCDVRVFETGFQVLFVGYSQRKA
jgi:hypothetical protein